VPSIKCSICGRRIRVVEWPSSEGLQTLRRHYKRYHGGWKRPATRDRRYKNPRRKRSFSLADVEDLVYEILEREGLI